MSDVSPPSSHPTRSRVGVAALLVLTLALFLARVGHAIHTYAQTVDEPFHVGSAVALWEAKRHVLGVEQPTLPRWVWGAALAATGAELPAYRHTTTSKKTDEAYAAGTEVLHARGPAAYRTALRTARYAGLVFPLTALLYAFLLGRHFGGPWAGAFAAALLSIEPTFVAHSAFITNDVAATAGFLAAAYHGWRFAAAPTWARAAAWGTAVGLGVACKFSVIAIVPAVLLAALVAALIARRLAGRVSDNAPPPRLLSLFSRTLAAACIAIVVLWATYGFAVGPLGDSDTLAAAPQWDRLPAVVKSTPVPMPAFWIGAARIAALSAQKPACYLLGTTRNGRVLAYFPVVILAKTPLALLAAYALATAALCLSPRRHAPALLALLLPAAVFLLLSMLGGIQIGVRHVLPVLALLCVAAALLAPSPRGKLALSLLLLAALAETLPRGPDTLSFFNLAAARTPDAAERIVVDSNLDWGQDLALLRGRTDLASVFPFGTRQAPLFTTLGLDPALVDLPPRPGDLVAVSRSRRTLGPGDFSFLTHADPVEQLGDGIVVYRVK